MGKKQSQKKKKIGYFFIIVTRKKPHTVQRIDQNLNISVKYKFILL